MNAEKIKEVIALFGGLLSALLLFFQAIQFNVEWFNDEFINALIGALMAGVPFMVAVYGVWKNTFLISPKAKEQEKYLKEKGLK